MTMLRTTAIMKTDISGSTARFRTLADEDLHTTLTEHHEFVAHHAAAHEGRIVKPEGDGFWIVFPSATGAALAAMAMQEEIRSSQANKGDDRLVMRVVITVGDVLHEDGALVGDTVVLTTRIEAITPPDEIYLSASAWLAVNQAEIRTAFVDTVALKSFPDAVQVYRVEQTHRTRVIADQYIVITDVRGFMRIAETAAPTTVEAVLEILFRLIHRITRELSGIVRFSVGDAYCLTFPEATLAMTAAEQLSEGWSAFVRQGQVPCPMNVAVHQGILYAFRSFLYGPGLMVGVAVQRASSRVLRPDEGGIFVTGQVQRELGGTAWEPRLKAVEMGLHPPRGAAIEIYRLS